MRTAPPQMLPLFRSEPQLRMLARLLLDPEAPLTTDDLAAASGMSAASLHRELHRAVAAGLVEQDGTRRPHRFQAATRSPMYEPVATLLRMTVGVERELTDVLARTDGVEVAALHGSWAAGTARPASDIDLLVVGRHVNARELRSQLRELGRRVGREVDLMLLERDSFDALLADENPFLEGVLKRPLKLLVGDERVLAAG